MFKLAKSKSVVVLLFAVLMLPAGMARADSTASSTTATSTTSPPPIVSGTDPEPASPGIIQIILTILTAS